MINPHTAQLAPALILLAGLASTTLAHSTTCTVDSVGGVSEASSSTYTPPGAGTTSPTYVISTVAGGAQPATAIAGTSVAAPDNPLVGTFGGVAADPAGNVYFASQAMHGVFKLNTSGILTRVAGNGIPGFSGDGGPATSAALMSPSGVAVDAGGNLYITEASVGRILKVAASNGVITTVAGSNQGYSGDGGPAISASLSYPQGLATDTAGNLYFADTYNQRVRKVTVSSGVITTVAGTGSGGYSGDGGLAVRATLNNPVGVAVDAAGNVYIADFYNNRIRKVTASTGVITTVAGGGNSGDGGAATSATLGFPVGVAVDESGNLYITSATTFRVRTVTASNGVIMTVAGGGTAMPGDGGAATSAFLVSPQGIAVTSSHNFYFNDPGTGRVRRVSSGGIISTVVGGNSGDGALAVFTRLAWPSGVARDSAGNLYVSDRTDRRVRKIASNGVITTVAGNGSMGYSGDGGTATSASLYSPEGLALDASGNVYIADSGNSRIRKVAVASGVITTVAGNGSWGSSGDGGPATSASLASPHGVAVDAAGNLYIADYMAARVRKVTAATGVITTVAGNGTSGYSGDGGAAADASLGGPQDVAIDAWGNLYIADYSNNCVRKVTAATDVITTVATGAYPMGVAVDAAGNVFIADFVGNGVRMLSVSNGGITTVAGRSFGYSGDGGPGASASLADPTRLTVDAAGRIYFADQGNGAVRLLTPTGTSPVLTLASTHSGAFTAGQNATYTVTVANAPSAGSTCGAVTVTEVVPTGLTLVSMSGPGWICNSASCTRNDVLSGGSSYPAITVTVNASTSTPIQVTNQVSVSGGCAATTGVQDLTIITGSSSGAGPGACSYTLAAGTPNPPSFSDAGGSGTATVTVGAGCTWTAASSDPSWLATSGSGSGSGTVKYTVAANTGATARTGAIAVGGQVLSVTQTGTAPPTVVLPTVTAVSSASYQAGGAPDSLVSVFGSNLAKALQPGTPNASGEWPQSIGGTSLEINGRPAPLVFVSPGQINCLVPGNTELGTAALNVKLDGTVIATGAVSITNTLPGLFAANGAGSGPAAALNAVTYAAAPFSAQTAENAGSDKRTRIALFGTGIRYAGNPTHAANTNVARYVGITASDSSGKSLTLSVEYAGPAPGFAGLDQVNVVLPTEANQDTTITVTVTAGSTSNAVTLAMRQSGIIVTPTDSDPFTISGTQGQFTAGAERKVYTVRNAGSNAVTLQVRTPAWLSAEPATAAIAGGASLTVTVATNSTVNALAAGPYFGTVDFSDGSATLTRSVALWIEAGSSLPTFPSGCQYAAAPTSQLFRALNTLSTKATVQWGTVRLPGGGYGSVPIGFEMQPGECDVYGLPARGDYDITVSRSGGGSNNLVVTFDGSSGFVISGRRVYTLRIASGACSAAADAGITFGGQAVYSVCP